MQKEKQQYRSSALKKVVVRKRTKLLNAGFKAFNSNVYGQNLVSKNMSILELKKLNSELNDQTMNFKT